jgi:hypothetical protein
VEQTRNHEQIAAGEWPPEDQGRAWAYKLWTALTGALILWVYVEPAFAAGGILWREFFGGFGSYLVLSLSLSAAVPVGAYFAARALEAANPLEIVKWASWPTALLLAYHWAMSSVFKDSIASNHDFGFIQFCNAGASLGIFAGFFGGFAYEPKRRRRLPPLEWGAGLARAAAGAAAVGACWWLVGAFLDFSWRRFSGDPDVYLYFTLYLLLGTPFFCAGLARDLGDGRGELGGVWAVPPTFAALYYVLGGSRALVNPSLADSLLGALPRIGLAQGAVCGALVGFGFRKPGRR